MHRLAQELPGTREDGWGGMVVGYFELPAGTDFTPLFEGLPNDACPCPHWGYVMKGAVHLRYTDRSEEVTGAGEVFYWPAGHTGWVEEDTTFLDFSPEKEHGEVTAHIARKREQSG